MTRRDAIARTLALGAMPAMATGQVVLRALPRKPSLCVYSASLTQVEWQDVGPLARDLGFDGIDLVVVPGGQVEPSSYRIDLPRTFDVAQVAGVTIPMVTTNFVQVTEPNAYPVMFIAGRNGARMFRMGAFPYGGLQAFPGPLPMSPLALVRNEILQAAALAQRCDVTALLQNRAGSAGQTVAEANALTQGIDPDLMGYCFDPAQAAAAMDGQWEPALTAAMPRIRAVAISDYTWDAETSKIRPCAMGEGGVDWKKFFAALAAAGFVGPISFRIEYGAKKAIPALTKDVAFARKLVDAAWPA